MNPFALNEPLVLSDPYLGRMSDDEFFNFCQSNRKWRIERNAAHDVLLIAPTFSLTGRRNARLFTQLDKWWDKHQEPGEIFDSNAGFTLANEAVRPPDASWVSAQRWNALTAEQQEKFATVCPEFVVELRSKTDSLKVLLAKMEECRENGAQLGWLLSCDDEKAYIFRAGQTGYETVEGFDRELSGEAVLPELRVDLRKLRQDSIVSTIADNSTIEDNPVIKMSYSYFKRKRSLEIAREDEFLDRVVAKRGLVGYLNNAKWVKLLHIMVANHNLIKECQVKLIWEEAYTGRLLRLDENTEYRFDYYDQAMEAMITGKPHGWWAYREIEWLAFPRHLTEQVGKQDLNAIQLALASTGQFPLVLTDNSLRIEAYRIPAE